MMQDATPPAATTPPTMTVLGGIYSFSWERHNVHITLERLREDSRRTVTADVTVKAQPEGHMHTTRLNLLATRSRTEITRYLATRCQRGRDWDAIVEQLCVMTLEHFRTGEPTVNLGELSPPASPVYRLYPWVVENESTILYGEGGIGKSMVAAWLSSMVDQAIVTDFAEPMPGKVLYLDYETTSDIAARRFQSIAKGFGFGGKCNVIYRFCHQSLPADISEVQRICATEDVSLIVVDSAGPACGGDPESAASAINYFTALRSLRRASITIAHRSKSNSIGPFGSVYWVNYPRMAYELRKSQEEESDVMHCALIHTKVNDGQKQKPVAFKIEWLEGGAVTVNPEEIAEVPDFVEELPIPDQLDMALKEHGPRSVKELAEITGIKMGTISTTLSRKGNKGRFQRIGNAKWDAVNALNLDT